MQRERGTFEELDHEPAALRRRGGGPARVLVGGLLALLALAAAWDWAQTSSRATAYHQGVAAVAARHWEAAAGAFAAAGGYADAPVRAGQVATQVAQLRASYAALEAAAARGDWATAYHAAQAVAASAPDYREVAAQLDHAYRQLIATGTAGVLYLQTGAAPGLYLRDAAGAALRLPGSTGHSRLLAAAPDRFVYDSAAGLTLATRQGPAAPLFAPLPAVFTRTDQLWLTTAGVWRSSRGGAIGFYSRTDLGVSYYTAIPAAAGVARRVAAASPAAVLLADNGAGAAAPATHLLRLTDAPSADGRSGWTEAAEAHLPGFLLTATLSPDGRYAAVQTEEVAVGITRTLYLLDFAQPAAAPRLIDRLAWQGVPATARLWAAFLPDPAGLPHDLLLERLDDGGLLLARYPLAGGPRVPLWAAPSPGDLLEQVAVTPDGQGIALRGGAGAQAMLVWLTTAGTAGPQSWPLPLLPGQAADWAAVPGGTALLGRVRNPDGADKGTSEALYSLSLPPRPGTLPRPLTLAGRAYDARYPAYALPAAGLLVAVISPAGILAAVPLDGSPATPLATDVDAVWALP